MAKRERTSTSSSSPKRARTSEPSVEVESENEDDNRPRVQEISVAETPSQTGGSYNATENEWQWQLNSTTMLRVSSFKGRLNVDVRKYWEGKPTTKGVSLPVELFKQVQQWDKLDEAVAKVSKKK